MTTTEVGHGAVIEGDRIRIGWTPTDCRVLDADDARGRDQGPAGVGRMLTRVQWVSCVAVMLVVAACDTVTSPSSTEDLHGGWQLVAFELGDGMVVRPTNAETYTARFAADDRLHVNADCNVCNGSYTATASTLKVGLMICTRAFCGPDSLHDSYLTALASGRSWERDEAALLVTYDEGTLHFTAE